MYHFTSSIEQYGTNLWGCLIVVPEEVARAIMTTGNRRLKATINGNLAMNCALMPDKKRNFILINKQFRSKAALLEGDIVSVILEPDNSVYGMDMPDEMAAVLAQDSLADKHFHALTPGKQRNLIYLVHQVKNTDSRIRKALAINQHLCEAEGKLDFKRLMQTIKEFNQQVR